MKEDPMERRAHEARLALLLADTIAADAAKDYGRRYGLILEALHIAHTHLGYPAGLGWDPDNAEAARHGCKAVAYIELPAGQVSWHMPEHPIPWDGHTTREKIDRILAFTRGDHERV